jgi:hypothetical protein
MPLNKRNTRTRHRVLYGGQLESVTLLKRDDGHLRQNVVTTYTLFQCRWQSPLSRSGQNLDGDITSYNSRTLIVPQVELYRVGVKYVSALDRFVDEQERTWQPESNTDIDERLFLNYWKINCLRV